MAVVSMKELLEAGVHFGHQTRRWNPRMKPYIFTERSGIHILDLEKTLDLLERTCEFVKETASQGKLILFVGTKKQAQEAIEQEAERCGMPYVNSRWLGGTLTNFATIKGRIQRLKELEEIEELSFQGLPKKEISKLTKEREKLSQNLRGLKKLDTLPGAVYVADPKQERIAAKEARKLEIPLVGIVDTNCDPGGIDYVIPGNDDAIRAVSLITRAIATAALEGNEIWELSQKARPPTKSEKSKAKAKVKVKVKS